jgi:ankyrin repeat protein
MPGSQKNTDQFGRTELHHAVVDKKIDLVKSLLDSGHNPSAADKSGWTALHFAAQDYQVEIVKMLIQHGVTVDAQDSYGNTPLWRAVFNSNGRGEVIELLRAAGANPNLTNKTNVSPLALAKTIGNYNVKQFFSDLIQS